MFDTNVFDRILDGDVSVEFLAGRVTVYATHIQRDEIANIPERKAKRRAALAALFAQVIEETPPTESFAVGHSSVGEARVGRDHIVPTESAAWGVSKWGQAKWTRPNNLCTPIRAALDKIKPKPNNIRDALIAETAIKCGYVLVTEDENLAEVACGFGARCMSVSDLIAAVEGRWGE